MNQLVAYSETTSQMIIRKIELAPIQNKKGLTKFVRHDTQKCLSSTLNNPLPSIPVKKPSVSSRISTMKSINKEELKLPSISSEDQNNQNPSVDSKQITECSTDSEVRSQIYFTYPFRVVWLHSNNANSRINYNYAVNRFRQSAHTIDTFTDVFKCLDSLQKENNEKIILILSNVSHQSIVREIHNLSRLHIIYIYEIPMRKDNQWINSWTKIQGVFTDIEKICHRLEDENNQIRRDSLSITLTSIDLHRLDSSFMYTQLLKEVLLEMEDDDDKARKEFIDFTRKSNLDKSYRMKIIDEFEQSYATPIWWYSRDCFICKMINRALRLQDINTIIQTRFFIRNLHKQIERLHVSPPNKLNLYRGQALSYSDFQQLCALKGGLYSFHSFLSTSNDRAVAFAFASSVHNDPNRPIGIIFHIDIDPSSVKSTIYASLDEEGYYKKEKEFLFTMHTVFRVGKIEKLDYRLYEVHLSLTNDNDNDLTKLAENIRGQVTNGSTGWDRLGQLLLKIGKFNQAEDVYHVLIQNSSKDDLKQLAHYYHLLGSIKQQQNDHDNALEYLTKTLNIYHSLSDSKCLDFSTLYNHLGSVYQYKQDYTKALEFHQMALDIQNESKPLNHSELAITYEHQANTYRHMEYYSNALEFYQKKLTIHTQSNPLNYTNLVHTYENIAEMYYQMNQYFEALRFFRRVFNIRQFNLYRNDIEIAIGHYNIGKVLERMNEHTEAITQYQYAWQILMKSTCKNFSQLTLVSYKIAGVYKKMGEPRQGLKFYHETVRNSSRASNLKELNLAVVYDDIGQIYEDINEYEQALLWYRQAIQKEQQSLSHNQSQLELFRKHLVNVTRKCSRLKFLI